MDVSQSERSFLQKWITLLSNDKEIELECILASPQNIKRTDFVRVLKYCRTHFKLFDEKRESLDIVYENNHEGLRVTLEGRQVIQGFCKNENIQKVPSKFLIKKTKEDSISLSEYGCKFNVKKEHEIQPDMYGTFLQHWELYKKIYRYKKRYSYQHGPFRIDLTVVKANYGARKSIIPATSFKTSNTIHAKESFEIEIECDGKNITVDDYISITARLLCVKNNIWVLLKRTVRETIEKEFIDIRVGPYKQNVRGRTYTLFNNKNVLSPGPQVVSMNMNRFRTFKTNHDAYTVTLKTDGQRMMGFTNHKGELYLLSSTHGESFIATGFTQKHAPNCIIDGELVRETKHKETILHYLIFDCYFQFGKDIRTLLLDDRLDRAKTLFSNKNIEKDSPFSVYVKQFLPCSRLYESVTQIMKESKESIYANDGLIFTPQDPVGGAQVYEKKSGIAQSNGAWDRLLKWKDTKENTIDFRVIFGEREESFDLDTNTRRNVQTMTLHVLRTTSGSRGTSEVEFRPLEPADADACITRIAYKTNQQNQQSLQCLNGDEILNGSIVEMSYKKENPPRMRWIPRNVRHDKTKPNAEHTAVDIWKIAHLPVTLDLLTQENAHVPTEFDEMDEYYVQETKKLDVDVKMRRFHTLVVKKDLITQDTLNMPKGARLLDLACGRGGDLNRYKQSHFKEIIGIDLSANNLENPNGGAIVRLEENPVPKKNIVFIHGDAIKNLIDGSAFHNSSQKYKTLAQKYVASPQSYDMVSMFFALHYMFENKNTLDTFIKNLREQIKPGGYFTGCCYDGQKVYAVLKEMGRASFKIDGTTFLEIQRDFAENKVFSNDTSSLGMQIRVLVHHIGKPHNEYLVNFAYFKIVMEQNGFTCTKQKNFEEYYRENASVQLTEDEKNASFLNIAFTFKRVS